MAYTVLERTLIAAQVHSKLERAVGKDTKGRLSLLCYAIAIPLAFVSGWLSAAIYAGVALIWVAPDPRIEKELAS